MLYTELLQLWDEAVQAVDVRDWPRALAKLEQIAEPTSRTLFNTASAHLALGHLDPALKVRLPSSCCVPQGSKGGRVRATFPVFLSCLCSNGSVPLGSSTWTQEEQNRAVILTALDLTLAKDERLAVGFFQRAAVLMQMNRLEEALSDCIWAQKHMRGNPLIDYRQLGLRFKLSSWQVLHNAAAVYCRMGQWERATQVLLSVSEDRGGPRIIPIDLALEKTLKKEAIPPLLVPEAVVFRPRKQDVEQLTKRDFLGKAKVITSIIPNDDFGGFEPLRLQKPGFYEPRLDASRDSRYMRVRTPFMAQGPGQLTVPGGATVFLFGEEDRDGMATVIFDGQRGLLPVSLLQPADLKVSKGKNKDSVPSGIPLPPELRPPARPRSHPSVAAPSQGRPPVCAVLLSVLFSCLCWSPVCAGLLLGRWHQCSSPAGLMRPAGELGLVLDLCSSKLSGLQLQLGAVEASVFKRQTAHRRATAWSCQSCYQGAGLKWHQCSSPAGLMRPAGELGLVLDLCSSKLSGLQLQLGAVEASVFKRQTAHRRATAWSCYATSDTPPPSYASATEAAPRRSAAVSPPRGQGPGGAAERDSVVVKVHYTYTLALSVPLDTSVHDLKQQIGQKLGQSASVLRLRQKQHGSRALVPVNDTEGSEVTVQEVAQAGRATLWCQTEDPLENRPILYQVVALYDYAAQGPEDLEFSEGDTIDILGEVNEEWLEGHCAGGIGIFPRCFAYRENFADTVVSQL
ncbi:Neutrophil cytosol factor 2 [Takifugu flavidus]|uniref:Neutrophil cytosol factor 2 n=1 Tax=Takifugu flavidus TaxID=433684 RepID=A0A5C6N278_9TELE|nr:Neutrophil cytosol factor 2 [Takifugu flavidus]